MSEVPLLGGVDRMLHHEENDKAKNGRVRSIHIIDVVLDMYDWACLRV